MLIIDHSHKARRRLNLRASIAERRGCEASRPRRRRTPPPRIRQHRETSPRTQPKQAESAYSQLQQSQVRERIVCPVLALVLDVVLEGGDSLGVVSVEASQDGVDVLRPGVGGDGLSRHFAEYLYGASGMVIREVDNAGRGVAAALGLMAE